MDRIIKIVIYSVVLLALWFWFSSIFKSCNSDATTGDDITILDVDTADDNEYVEDDFFADEVDNDSDNLDLDNGYVEETSTSYDQEDEVDYTNVADYTDSSYNESRERVNSSSSPNNINTSTTQSNGRYLVIAGSYLVESNANEMKSKINNLGYNAEVVVFDLSQFHSVCAGRYNDYDKALTVSSRLKQQGIDNYVHTKK